jgi:hypothetical protein
LFQLKDCNRIEVVDISDLQIDTLKIHKTTRQQIVTGEIISWQDTTKAFISGEVQLLKKQGDIINEGDTILYLLTDNGAVNDARQQYIDHSAIQSLRTKIKLLKKTLQRIDELKSQNVQFKESDLEQLIISLENTGLHVNNLNERVDYHKVIQGIVYKIKKLSDEVILHEKKLSNKHIAIEPISIVSNCAGKINILVENYKNVKPGDPLFFVKSDEHDPIVIKLDQLPREELKFSVNVKINEQLLNLKFEDLYEDDRILRVTENIVNRLVVKDKRVKLSFESKPSENLMVKKSAIFTKGKEHYVFVKRGNYFKSIPVEIGSKQGAMIEIKDGLQPNDQIIVSSSKPIWHWNHLQIKH